MAREDGIRWAKKAYLWLAIIVVAVIWIAFGVHFGIQGHGPHEDNWFQEVTKWLFATPFIVIIVGVIAYGPIYAKAARIGLGIDTSLWDELKALFGKIFKKKAEPVSVEEVAPVEEIAAAEEVVESEEAPVAETVVPVKRTRKKKVVEE